MFNDIKTIVWRVVVYENNFQISVSLIKYATCASTNILFYTINRY